jgi:uncharacterized repeat protein (TIGR01451 family)
MVPATRVGTEAYMFVQRRAVVGTGALSLVALMTALVLASGASAQGQGQNIFPSDERAVFRAGVNATLCAHLLTDDVLDDLPSGLVQVGKNGPANGSDARVQGTVTNGGHNLQITTPPGVVVRAVVVKGGNGYNAYVNPDVLPPNLGPPQNYISPRVGKGNPTVAEISHWFVCYTLSPRTPGTVRVFKTIKNPVGVPVTPLKTRYRVRVTCNGADPRREIFVFGGAGGVGTIEDTDETEMEVPEGARCEVEELNIDELPEGCIPSYIPDRADDPGVRVGEAGRDIRVLNDCSGVRVQENGFDIVKVTEGSGLPDSFAFDVVCTDGSTRTVTVPASGAPPGRVEGIRADSTCFVTERTGSLPADTQVSYLVNGEPSREPAAAAFEVPLRPARVIVTVRNQRPSTPPPPPPPPPPDVAPESRPEMDPDKIVSRGLVRAGARVRYTIVVHNRGFAVARRALVCDRLPRDLTLVSAPGARLRNGEVCWRIARLRPLASRRFPLTARANERASGSATNVATADMAGAPERTAGARITIRPRRGLAPGAVTG